MSVMFDSHQYATLHKIKKTQFLTAQKTVVQKKDFLQSAQASQEQARTARVEFAHERQKIKTRLYEEEIHRGGDKLNKISDVNYELQVLKQRLLEYEQEEVKASEAVAAAQLELTQAREQLMQSQRALTKYDEIGIDVKAQASKALERNLEKEFEDYRYRPDMMGG